MDEPDAPPPLPDTQDPFALLGVSPDDDARALRRAYARLIKHYRPDRAAEQFARIHAAFEHAQLIRRLRAHGIAAAPAIAGEPADAAVAPPAAPAPALPTSAPAAPPLP